MRVIASVQSKRGSSRGLIHYIAHSKIDTTREPETGRELFNAFADELSVKSANNSIKANIIRGRPSNDELHHLVLSFRADDYRALGRTEKHRRAALKETTRAAMKSLENALDAYRISWAAAVHLNTENPHVHIAIQKEFLARDLETRVLTKIPREALPHFEDRDGEKTLTPGILIEAATEKMEQLIAGKRERVRSRDLAKTRHKFGSPAHGKTDGETDSKTRRKTEEERDILRRGMLAEHELRRIESKIETLTDQGDRMRFRVTDPVTGQKRRLSLCDLERRAAGSDALPDASPARQIRTILFKMLTKEEKAKEHLQKIAGDTIRDANGIRALYKKNGWKLPAPSLTKSEIDNLQDHCLEESNIRRFSYLESIRTQLEKTHEIEPRRKEEIKRLAARKTIAEMREHLLEKNYIDLDDRQFYRLVDVGDKRVSLAHLDREENASTNTFSVFAEKLKQKALRLIGKAKSLPATTGNDRLRNDIVSKLNEQLSGIIKDRKTEENKVKILEKILTASEGISAEPVYSTEQLAEMETISMRLKTKAYYDKSWNEQRALIESAGSDSPAARRLLRSSPSADLNEYKTSVIAGRSLAREIAAKVEFEKAKEDLKIFTESKHFQKFAVADTRTGSVAFLSLHDVDLPRRSSILDRAVNEIFESREHRSLRRTVTSLVRARERRLREDLDGAREILASASRDASEVTHFSVFGPSGEPMYRPIFTTSEITTIEMRAATTANSREAARLRRVLLESTGEQHPRSLKEILRDFESPSMTYTNDRELDTAVRKVSGRTEVVVPGHVSGKQEKLKEPKFHSHSR